MNAHDETMKELLLHLFDDLKDTNEREHAEIKELIRSQNGRIRALENWRVYLVGIAIGVSGVIGVLLKMFTA